jgi:hypothetical protein
MAKIQVTLDAAKMRSLISKREYTNKNKETVILQEVKFELVEVKDPKIIFDGEKHQLVKTHFAAAIQTKAEREAKTPTNYIGEGFTTVFKDNAPTAKSAPTPEQEEMPF